MYRVGPMHGRIQDFMLGGGGGGGGGGYGGRVPPNQQENVPREKTPAAFQFGIKR